MDSKKKLNFSTKSKNNIVASKINKNLAAAKIKKNPEKLSGITAFFQKRRSAQHSQNEEQQIDENQQQIKENQNEGNAYVFGETEKSLRTEISPTRERAQKDDSERQIEEIEKSPDRNKC